MTTLRLGALMREAGYEETGADPVRNYHGSLPWFGSLPEVEHRTKDLTTRRATGQTALDEALLDDAARAKAEAGGEAYRDLYNGLHLKHSKDGDHLVPHRADGSVLPESELTPAQAAALARGLVPLGPRYTARRRAARRGARLRGLAIRRGRRAASPGICRVQSGTARRESHAISSRFMVMTARRKSERSAL